jgi:hypothetical protein
MKNEKQSLEKRTYAAPDVEIMRIASKLNILQASLPNMGGEEW